MLRTYNTFLSENTVQHNINYKDLSIASQNLIKHYIETKKNFKKNKIDADWEKDNFDVFYAGNLTSIDETITTAHEKIKKYKRAKYVEKKDIRTAGLGIELALVTDFFKYIFEFLYIKYN